MSVRRERIRARLGAYRELTAVLIASLVGLTVQTPLRWLVRHQGINVLLVVLVFTTASTITIGNLRAISTVMGRVVVTLVAASAVLAALAWGVARIVTEGPLRNGVLTVGLAPCEIASVATVAIAGGAPAVAAAILVGSTVISAALAGPLLGLESGQASISSGGVVVNLVVVVIVPLVAGITLRAVRRVGTRHDALMGTLATAAVVGLVALIASQIRLSTEYLAVAAALVLFTIGAAALGWFLALGAPRDVAIPILLTTSMRDFAIAAGIATSAFGAHAAAPLGLYGIVVLIWGTAAAGRLRQPVRPSPPRAHSTRRRNARSRNA